jgi:uncharacterized membrane protein YdjX (TVP38/TMEM64 family)
MTEFASIMPGTKPNAARRFRQWLPALALVGLIGLAYGFGLHRHVSLVALAENREQLRQFVDSHFLVAVLAFMAAYIAVVALSIPGAAVMSIAGGFLFGWMISVPVTITAAVIGAIIVFQIVKTSLGAALAERAGPLVQRVSQGFAENAFSYLLFLRLAPVFPFFMVNAVAGLCRVPVRTFIIATAIGIIPGSLAFALLGAGLDDVINTQRAAYEACAAANGAENCSFSLDVGSLVTRELLLAFAGLGLVALLPVAFKYFKRQPT